MSRFILVIISVNMVGALLLFVAGIVFHLFSVLRQILGWVKPILRKESDGLGAFEGTFASITNDLRHRRFTRIFKTVVSSYGWPWTMIIVGFLWLGVSLFVGFVATAYLE